LSELLAKYENVRLENIELVSDFVVQILEANSVVLFYGDLGSGKTTLCSSIIRSFLGKGNEIRNDGIENRAKKDIEITSPTFNILHTYQVNDKILVNHYDLYRIEFMQELMELGFLDSLFNNITLIEWPKFLHNFFMENRGMANILEIHIDYKENSRDFLIKRLDKLRLNTVYN
jgi:tRNA threonylcarbamoyladenosine biosynthesis protein TsaE